MATYTKIYVIVILSVLVSITQIAECQKLILHPERMFQGKDGRIYLKKSMPVYFRIATSPDDDAESFLLKSETTPKYANPMYLDTDGKNTFRSPSCVDTVTKKVVKPLRDVIFEVYADGHSPVTKHQIVNKDFKLQKGLYYTSGMARLYFNSIDDLSGINTIYYSIDSAEYRPFLDTIKLDEERVYSLQYYAIDNVGNNEKVKNIKIRVDHSKPKTNMSIEGNYNENILASNVLIKLISTDEGIGLQNIRYSLDGGPERLYVKPINTLYLEQGDHQLTYYATDKVNNKEVIQTYDFYVDKTPPAIVQEIIGKSFIANGREFSSGRSQLKITTFDNKAGVKEVFYSINNGPYKLYEKPVILANSSGSLNIKSYAVDWVKNKSVYDESGSDKKSYSYVDLTGPELSNKFEGPIFVYNDTVFVNHSTQVVLDAIDGESGLNRIEYSVNQSDFEQYTKPFTINNEGFVSLKYIGYDNVDNTNNNTLEFFVDTTGPEIQYNFSAPAKKTEIIDSAKVEFFPTHVVLFVSVTDKYTGFQKMTYGLNGSNDKEFVGTVTDFPKKDKNIVTLRAYDKLGNFTEKTLVFGIENSIKNP